MTDNSYQRDTFSEYVLTVWKKKSLILGFTLLLVIISIVLPGIETLISEKYEVTAEIYVGQAPPISGMDYDILQTPAITFETLLVSDELINEVMQRYMKEFPSKRTKLEFFNKRFDVTTVIAEDTSVRRRYSPVVELETSGSTPEEAKFIMKTWVDLAIERYGDLPARSIRFYLDYYLEQLRETQSTLQKREDQFIKVKWELHAKTKELIDKENILSPANIPLDLRRQAPATVGARTQQSVDVVIQQQEDYRRTGLLAERAKLDIEIARLEALETSIYELLEQDKFEETSIDSSSLQSLKKMLEDTFSPEKATSLFESITQEAKKSSLEKELQQMAIKTRNDLAAIREQRSAMQKTISQLKSEISVLQMEVTELERKYEHLRRDVEDLRDKYGLVSRFKNEVESFAGVKSYQGDFPETHRSELQLVGAPVKPQVRAYPKRSIFALLALAIGLFIGILYVIFNKYLTDISISHERAKMRETNGE